MKEERSGTPVTGSNAAHPMHGAAQRPKAASRYEVLRADLDGDAEALARLWQINLAQGVRDAARAEDKLRWLYRANPQGVGAAFLLTSGRDGATRDFVGCVGLAMRRFCVRGEPHLAAMFIDLAVDKEHRTLFPAMMLQRAARRHCKTELAFGFGTPNEKAISMFSRLGYVVVGHTKRYARVLRSSRYLERYVGRGWSASLGGALVDSALAAQATLRVGRLLRRYRLEWVEHVDERFDRLWDTARGDYAVIGYRGADFLRWRFVEAPQSSRNEIAALVDPSGSRIEAYAAVRRNSDMAHIVDLFGPVDRLAPLLWALAPALRARGCASASIRLHADARVEQALRTAGFRFRELNHAFVVDPSAPDDALADTLRSADQWYLTDADIDG